MSTTTVRLPDDLKERLAAAATRAGMSPHAFILDAIAERVEAEDKRHEFHVLAEQRYADILASGRTIPWSDMQAYLRRRLGGDQVLPHKARKLKA